MQDVRRNAPVYLVGAAVISTTISISVFEIFMALGLAALLIGRARWRVPRIWIPLGLFMAGTLISLAASGHAREGLPQIKKFYVYLMLFLVASAFASVRQIRVVVLAWSVTA